MDSNPIIPEILENRYCQRCPLIEDSKLIATRNRSLEVKKHYFPRKIKALLVAESPPTRFFTQPDRYFYAPGRIKYGTLFYFMMSAIFEKELKICENYPKEYFLDKFKKDFYLTDMVKCPIDKLGNEKKNMAIDYCSEYLKQELHKLEYNGENLIFIGKSTFKKAEKKLDLKYRPIVIPLPFGSKKNVDDFKKGLKQALGI